MSGSSPAPSTGRDGGAPHPLAGFASVDDSARLLRNYRYAVERMMRMLGGWIALTPELSAKLLLGRHVWDCAQHADLLGKRLPELRALAHVSEPATPGLAAFMDSLEEPELPGQTVERLVGVYQVLKPHLIDSYQAHLGRVNEVYEPPTQRIIARMIDDERRHVHAGLVILRHLATSPALEERGRVWQAHLEGRLAEAGGVTGAGMPAPAELGDPAVASIDSDDPHEFVRWERSLPRWPMPEALERALDAFGGALVAGDAQSVRQWLTDGAAHDLAAAPVARLLCDRHRVVAFAKIGDKRVIKLRLDGRGGSATVLSRWAPTESGWRAELLDLVGVAPAPPA